VTGPGRDPYRHVKLALRQEVGFCCPVTGCGSPYLTWHHFDPPWRVEHHHRPEGMIALCRAHADKADNGSFSDDQLRQLKREGKSRALEVRGRFDWMRQDLLAVVGGSFYYKTRTIFEIGNVPCIWFDRDENDYLLLNFRMPSIVGRPRARIDQNFWSVAPAVEEVVCPPSGKLVEVRYHNGDQFRAEFCQIASPDELDARYPEATTRRWSDRIRYPLCVAELWETAAGTSIEFGPSFSRLPGNNMFINCFMNGCGTAIHFEVPQDVLTRLFPDDQQGDD
jgi:hypothetical protein